MEPVGHVEHYPILAEEKKPADKPSSSSESADQREHEGAVEDQVEKVPAPSGREYDDEPKQG
jgi:hypothetical protein